MGMEYRVSKKTGDRISVIGLGARLAVLPGKRRAGIPVGDERAGGCPAHRAFHAYARIGKYSA